MDVMENLEILWVNTPREAKKTEKPAVLPVPAARRFLVRSAHRPAAGSCHEPTTGRPPGRNHGFRWEIDLSEARTGALP